MLVLQSPGIPVGKDTGTGLGGRGLPIIPRIEEKLIGRGILLGDLGGKFTEDWTGEEDDGIPREQTR